VFQPEVKLEFIRRYCSPQDGWKVFVDIDPSEEGRTGGERVNDEARERQKQMQEDADRVRTAFHELGVTVGGNRSKWYRSNNLPVIEGDRDIVAFHFGKKFCVIAEAEGSSSGQPEQKLYKAIGQIVMAASNCVLDGWRHCLVIVVHGKEIAVHLERVKSLEKLNISAVSIVSEPTADCWLFGKSPSDQMSA
jgi:hypothetical protein